MNVTPPPSPSLKGRGKYRWLGLLVMGVVLALDQWSKALVVQSLTRGEVVLTPFFNLVRVGNTGISFGMLAGQNATLLLTIMSLAITAILLVWLLRNDSKLVAGALGCVMGGALGNVIDRLRLGAVVDFLDFHLGPYHWPAFNVADSAIFIGVVLLCGSSMLCTTSGTSEKKS